MAQAGYSSFMIIHQSVFGIRVIEERRIFRAVYYSSERPRYQG